MSQRQTGSPDNIRRMFPRQLGSVPAVLEFVDDLTKAWTLPVLVAGDLKVALDELFTNMVKYQPENKRDVAIEAARKPKTVVIQMREWSPTPYDITEHPDPDLSVGLEQREPRGLGIYFVRHLMDEVRYDYDPDTQKSIITLVKNLEEGDVSNPQG